MRLTGRVFSQALDRSRPLWEIWLVEGLSDGRFAVLSKTHHALVDGISGVDIMTVLFDTSPEPMPVAPPDQEWVPAAAAQRRRSSSPMPCSSGPRCRRRWSAGVRAALRGPRAVAGQLGALDGRRRAGLAGLQSGASSPFNVPIGPHRRFTWVRGDLAEYKAVKNALCGTVNDVVLTVVAGGLGRYMRLHGEPTDDLELRAMVPVSVRADVERGRWAIASPPCGRRCRSASPIRWSGCARSAHRWRS